MKRTAKFPEPVFTSRVYNPTRGEVSLIHCNPAAL
jgi:hypothetical protein